ncbi:putative TIR domain, P-loop containing nucleoside triphosphate hydrolase [Helianthus annuus]|nr:putative TIR domain, P-loop containing nucleoside triphosphate hydrolase [Helianthus annuus]KAJ0574901.1 putative TIR domain, P-loop containing nucleoside triphosphate hydrolase [Helianthus annuus]KAJ0739231.1 putative TIR domain, P-loop containing nucleoside triphosphate hydrolase [Helianthus annuus]
MTRVRLFGSSQVIPSEKTAGLPNPQPSLPFRFYEKFVKGVVARIMFFLAAYIHFLLLWNPCSLRGESFWWYSATINSRVKTSKVDLSVKISGATHFPTSFKDCCNHVKDSVDHRLQWTTMKIARWFRFNHVTACYNTILKQPFVQISKNSQLYFSIMAATITHHPWTYNVFVSFRGKDIRKSFIDHLFKDFKQKGIHAFRDDNELPRGEEISSQLYKAIEESRFLIVIFSKNYASSSWCLRELVKILDCKQNGKAKHEVHIIFYDVKPDVVRKQTGSYAEAFAKHEIFNRTHVAKWKEALSSATNLSGWDLQDMANGYEAKFIDSITKEILVKLCNGPLHVGENLVGVEARVNRLNLIRLIGDVKVNRIGICGIGGIGKTTFAKAIYNMLYIHFEACSFCENVQGTAKRHGLAHVLTQLIDDIMKTRVRLVSNVSQGITILKQAIASKRILLVLDDVDHSDQIEALAGSQDWFFPGSMIIFTSKDKQLLTSHIGDEIYDMVFLNENEAFELFNLHAFGEINPTEDFKELANEVVQYVQGHPLALKVLGRFLYKKTVPEWKSELQRLKVYLNPEIQQMLRLSFDGLSSDQQRIFLDIACSFIGVNKDLAASVLDSCNCFADADIRVLVDKSLITISSTSRSLQMHDLIQSMAREIVRKESDRPGDRSRLWIPTEVYDVLNNNKVTQSVEVLVLLLEKSCRKVHIDCKSFARMNKLRILKICDLELENLGKMSELKLPYDSKVNFYGSVQFLSNTLRLLYWHGYPMKILPPNFYPENIVAIDFSYSNIQNLWRTPKVARYSLERTLQSLGVRGLLYMSSM